MRRSKYKHQERMVISLRLLYSQCCKYKLYRALFTLFNPAICFYSPSITTIFAVAQHTETYARGSADNMNNTILKLIIQIARKVNINFHQQETHTFETSDCIQNRKTSPLSNSFLIPIRSNITRSLPALNISLNYGLRSCDCEPATIQISMQSCIN